MKKAIIALFVLSTLVISAGLVTAAKGGKNAGCTTIQDGTLLTSAGDVITTGYDQWGYNYQANMFNGHYCDSYRDAPWCQPYKDVKLSMKWNDAWLSNKDCDGDGLLDRHQGSSSYIGSGAWLTNHMRGDGWTYFVKIVAKPTADYDCESIWGSFCITQEVNSGEGATIYDTPGLGNW